MLEHVGPRTACSFGTWHKDPNEHAVFGSCRGYVRPMWDLCWCYVAPCWAHLGLCWRLSGVKFQSQRTHGSVEIEFWFGFGLMPGHLEAMLGLCWAILGLCGAILSLLVMMERWYPAGPPLDIHIDGHVGPMWGLCWPYFRACWAKNGVFIWALALRPKWTRRFWVMSGLCWVSVGTYRWVLPPSSFWPLFC